METNMSKSDILNNGLQFEHDPLYEETFQQFGLLSVVATLKYVDQSYDHEFGTEKSRGYEVSGVTVKSQSGTDVTSELKLNHNKEYKQVLEAADIWVSNYSLVS